MQTAPTVDPAEQGSRNRKASPIGDEAGEAQSMLANINNTVGAGGK
ncbi:MAG: hypothetical protein IRY89_14380 [Pseudolabrys sp.]|nr:hypothetical protein [Pseudolabrys sp.]